MVSFFFFKQKTAYEVRISDWSSDVCSSDLYIGLVYVNVESNLIAAAYTTLVFLVRLLVLCLTLPLFLMAAFVGLVDGLVRRDIRRFGAGRESGFIYPRPRASLIPLAVMPWVTYLALSLSVNPLLILLPSAAFFRGGIRRG